MSRALECVQASHDDAMPDSGVFVGSRVRLRPVREDDIELLMEWDSDAEITRWTGKSFGNREEAKVWYLHSQRLVRRTMIIELANGRPIGEIEVVNITWRSHIGELRVVIGDRTLWNKGLGQDAIGAFVKGLFETTSLREVFLRVDQDNVRARKCYRKVGFKAQGRVRVPEEGQSERSRCLILMTITEDTLT